MTRRRKQPGHRRPELPKLPELPELPKLPSPEPNDEIDHLICVLRDQLRRADAFVTSAEKELVVSWGVGGDDGGEGEDHEDEDDGLQRRRMCVEYLVEAGKFAVREAQYTSEQLAAELAAQRRDA